MVSPYIINGVQATLIMIVIAVAISKIQKKERKGAGYSLITVTLVVSILMMLFNLWKFAQETGAASYMGSMKNRMFAKSPMVAGSVTNVGTTAVQPVPLV